MPTLHSISKDICSQLLRPVIDLKPIFSTRVAYRNPQILRKPQDISESSEHFLTFGAVCQPKLLTHLWIKSLHRAPRTPRIEPQKDASLYLPVAKSPPQPDPGLINLGQPILIRKTKTILGTIRSILYTFEKDILRGGPCTPTIPAISLTGSPPPLDIIIQARLAFLKEIKEGNYESKPGPAALPYPPFRRPLFFSLNLEEVTTPLIFADGSKGDSVVGAAIIFPSKKVLLRLHPDCIAFQAELLAILWEAQIAETSSTNKAIPLAAICSSGPIRTSLVAKIIKVLNRAPYIRLCWVPGHIGINGNELADSAVKIAATSVLLHSYSTLPRTHARNLTHMAALSSWTQHLVDVAFIQETNTSALNEVKALCYGYCAVVVPPATARGSGLACVYAPGVSILCQTVLWPGNISRSQNQAHNQTATFINCHLVHAPSERLQQLQTIAVAAVHEDAISEESATDITSGSIETLTELLDQADLIDAVHIPTRVASCGSRVDAGRLDRILIPLRLSDHVKRYWTFHYRLSDHRTILLQMGKPPDPHPPCISAMLRSGSSLIV
ncbi:hypothetical protein LAZ67_6002131 [Cordylochernes scorpioides]|uniref:RNase H type-1 domain-containing protein n=1 Tax=Cordylochernes scorpioides TaxID=51811 RepID=A0ABY6KMJ9_9ARAC|nr:hypothetical protein LAZ67_6002131 [Cordylochernes scorpioides]